MRSIESERLGSALSPRLLKQWACAVLVTLALAAYGTVPLELPPEARQSSANSTHGSGSFMRAPHARRASPTLLMRSEVRQASVAHFERFFTSMFTQAVALPDWPPWRGGS